MEEKKCALSFIIPIYNVESYLAICLDSILNLSELNWEIILINDGSTDCSGEIADLYAKKDNRIHVYHQLNSGLSNTRNRGILLAQGEYIAFVDSDDWLIDNQIMNIYKNAICNQVDIAMGNVVVYYAEKKTGSLFNPIPDILIGKTVEGVYCFTELMKNNSYPPMVYSYLYRREWLLKESLHFENVLHEDELWTPIALCLAKRVIVTNIDFYGYRQREGSIMHTLKKEKRIGDLIFAANELINFASRYTFVVEEQRDLKSQLYVKVFWLYSIAFSSLREIKDSRFVLPSHYLYCLFRIWHKLTLEARRKCLFSYRIAKRGLKEYLLWKTSSWASLYVNEYSTQKLILVYNTMWNFPLDIPMSEIPANCLITTDRACLHKADVVVFHLPDLNNYLEEDLDKLYKQKWVAWSLESEANYPFQQDPEFMDAFDYRMSYHQNADIIYPYYQDTYPELLLKKQVIDFEQKKDICMLISSPYNESKRQEYLRELMSFIEIDSYGQLFNNKKMESDSGHSSKMKLYESYKFVISFENSCTVDYVTEKFYDPLLAGAVPIYLGAPNIEEFSPGENCFVDVCDFDSPQQLASFLSRLCRDEKLYNRFLDWKKASLFPDFLHKTEGQKVHPFIRLCELISEEENSIA